MSSIGEHVDRLSCLPQDVLLHILSLMPTKFAVRTSLLSKTWRYTWTFVHNLNFDTSEDHKYLHPKHMDWVLKRWKTSQVKIFRVHFSPYYDYSKSYSEQLISKVISLHVHDLDMKGGYLKLPTSLFTCKTLTKLKLDCIRSPSMYPSCPSLSCPSFVNLPNLKTLDVVIKGQYWESALKLIHGCPVLESLYVEMDYWNNEGNNYFKIPTLKRLNLKIKFRRSELLTDVVLDLPNLEYFLFDGVMDFPFVLEESSLKTLENPSFVNLSNLKTLDVVIHGKYSENALKLIHGCPVLESLYVEMDWWNYGGDNYFKILTLKRFNLKVNFTCAELITDVVLNLPNLEYFFFDGFLDFPLVIEETRYLIEAKASCVVYHDDQLVQLLKAINQAKSIYLNIKDSSGGDDHWDSSGGDDHLDSSGGDDHLDLPMFFPNLKQLVLEGYVGPQWNLIPQFLQRSPKLEHLTIGTALHDYGWNKLKSIPTCMRVNLKTVKYKDGCDYHDFEFLKFILSYSKVLKTLTVECDTTSSLILRANLTKLRKVSIKGEIRLQFRSPINKTIPELTVSRDGPYSETFCTTALDHMNTAFKVASPIIFYCLMLVPLF